MPRMTGKTPANPQTSAIKHLYFRATLYKLIRQFFEARNVLEVETPIISFAGNPDPALLSFSTQYHGPGSRFNQLFYLNTSPEFCMKRLLAAGSGPIYSLCKVFRDGECGARHNPEFTMLEWYQPSYSLEALMDETIDLIQYLYANLYHTIQLNPLPVRKITYRDLFLLMLQLDPMTASTQMLQNCANHHHLDLNFIPKDKDEWLDLIISHIIEPRLNPSELTLVYHYPASQASLAQTKIESGFLVGERVEIYWQGLELANGFHELTNPTEQRARFEQNNHARIQRGANAVRIDEAFLETLSYLPDCSGIAVGIDRVIMCLLGVTNIAEVLSFDFNHA